VNEQLILDSTKALVDTGLRDVGYRYVVLDDCWSDGRGADGYVRVDKQRFPSGMKRLAEQIHDQNMLYGMYSSAGEQTCARYEGSLDWEVQVWRR
jgi:alpha-galactosidase